MKLIKSARANELLSTIGGTEAVRVTPMDCIDLPDSRTYIIHEGKVREIVPVFILKGTRGTFILLQHTTVESLPEVK